MKYLIFALLFAVAFAGQAIYSGELTSARGSCRSIRVTLCNRFIARVKAATIVKNKAYARLTFWQKRVAFLQAQLKLAQAKVVAWTIKYKAAVAALKLAVKYSKTVCAHYKFHVKKQGKVTFYQHVNYQGSKWTTSKKNVPQIGKYWLNKHLSSLVVPKCTKVILFSGPNFTGRKVVIKSPGTNSLFKFNFNDQTSSFKIRSTCSYTA